MAFDVLPEPLDRIEIGAIGRQIKWFDVMHNANFLPCASWRCRAREQF
jgi:hypothetical protein